MVKPIQLLPNQRRSTWLHASIGLLLATGLFGCLTMPETATDSSPRLRVNLNLERPANSTTQLKALHLTVRSNRGHIIRDTITDLGGTVSGVHVLLNPAKHQGQILMPRYDLPEAGQWSVSLQTLDQNDSVVHQETYDAGVLVAGGIHDVQINATARLAAFEGVFVPRGTTPGGLAIRLQRFEMEVDGRATCEAALAASTSPGAPVKIGCPYLPTGAHEVATKIYGTVGEETTPRVLWEGRKHLEIKTEMGTAVPITLAWIPAHAGLLKTTEAADLVEMNTEFRLGRVGTVVMNVIMPAAVIL